jgi:hypothetical protein
MTDADHSLRKARPMIESGPPHNSSSITNKREIAADVAPAREFLRQARKPPCEQCLRPASPCKERCLRSMLRRRARHETLIA